MAKPPRFPTREVLRIVVLTALLVAILVLKERCGRAGDALIHAFDVPAARDAGHD